MLESVKAKLLQGVPATIEEALELDRRYSTDELADVADEVRKKWCGDVIDTCSIVNARSGRCSEDCKWCAQSRHHSTGIDEYSFLSAEDTMKAARMNVDAGVRRFSMVTSGRKVSKNDLKVYCATYSELSRNTGLYLCASMGLLNKDELQMLHDAGVKRYHCNLETSSRYFPSLCSTHSHEEKLRTIKAAREAGMEICCGGIIGMGEELEDRLMLAQEAREAGAVSIPINILNPIKGTALQDTPLISEDEIIRSVALMRFIAPKLTLRFAGGRMRLSKKSMERILRGGMNGALVGDMLTTVGNAIAEDKEMFKATGYREEPLTL